MIDQNKTFAELALEGIRSNSENSSTDIENINLYMLDQLQIDYETLSEEKRELYLKNFVHLMCQVISDIKQINERIAKYQAKYQEYANIKSNEIEFRRRKIEYFCDINKGARAEIMEFIQKGISEYLLENNFDTLHREKENDELSNMYLQRRYMSAQFPEYYDMDFDFSTVVKTKSLPNIDLMDMLHVEKEYLELNKSNKELYEQKFREVVDNEKLLDRICCQVTCNYHMNKRKEIFLDLKELFEKKHYQSFMALGLLQLEGLFSDLCQIKYGTKENQGTLVEKVKKSFQGRNEITFMKYYPYFAFDVPIQRNEIAHKGMIEADNIETAVYNLILDLNTVVILVKQESYNKFIPFFMIYENIGQEKLGQSPSMEEMKKISRILIKELIANSAISGDEYWKIIKNPMDYEIEMSFYDSEDEEIDLSEIVAYVSSMIHGEDFWRNLLDLLIEYEETSDNVPDELYSFGRKIKNEFISDLGGTAKEYCVKIAQICK